MADHKYTWEEFNRKMEEIQRQQDEYKKLMSRGFEGVIR